MLSGVRYFEIESTGMYTVRHWWGEQEIALPPKRFAKILSELKSADEEHPDVSLTHESEWTLSYGKSGLLVFENAETGKKGEERHMKGVSPKLVLEYWRRLAKGDLAWLELQPWQPGYGSR